MTTLAPPPTETPPTARHGRDILDPDLFARLTARLGADHPDVADNAERIIDQTSAFLATCAANPDARFSPSAAVDLGWHTFLLFTWDYAVFCREQAGRFLHHVPDEPGEAPAGVADRGATVAAIRQAGYEVHADLWFAAGQCSQCYQGCHDDPKGV
ncbi:glycine-rich domain-containing protein [Pseudofrankia inefficax]|uniref:Uncharacterized protein n=1 Tax=Pseudofrankia inefficax (strain DSM 45817 / CECT 9037 / DDB 130130 / EuI1c) TaxID=298654 RepID=E3J701_PSEI1|nr:hypothetical protein [Pseudofrankia inefficax]ADP83221.1 hypothetical protein FraEuI1c_5233 [Pseudofrankia inefficax]